jgi:AcrR family transcriptional regulator
MPKYDRAATEHRIFDAAIAEFAEHGLDGARMDRIAEMAESSKGLIYTYFGNKEELFAKVLQKRLTDMAEAVTLRSDDAARYVGELFDFLVDNPDVVHLVLLEASAFAPVDVPQRTEREGHYADKVRSVATAQAAGGVAADLDPRFVVFSLISLASYFVGAPQIAQMVIGEPLDARVRGRYKEFLVSSARKMLAD